MTVKQLEMLGELLHDDARSFAERRDAAVRDTHRCREATEAIRALIPKLAAARVTQQPRERLRLPGCANDDQL